MTAAIIVAALVTGFIAGWCLTASFAAAAIHRSQAKMQRKVSYWQAEARRAQAQVEERAGTAMAQSAGPGR
jgi:outer membrane lipoprotein SlyB